MSAPAKWLKRPGPGQFRGDGEWRRIGDDADALGFWEHCKATGYLPTHEGDAPPDESDQ